MSDRFFVATRKGLFTFLRDAAGGSWRLAQTSFLADPCTAVLPNPRDGAIYVALKHGHFGPKMHRSDDGGASWNEIGCPTYPPAPSELAPNEMGQVIPWKLKLAWVLEPADTSGGALWCGTLPGGLFRSDDRGESWSLNRALWDRPERQGWFGGGYDEPGIHSISIDPRAHERVTVGISCGGVWRSEDSGHTWSLRARGMRAEYMPPERAHDENIQDPHILVRCRDHPDHLWVQHHNGVFRSRDDGAEWEEISSVEPSSFGFATAVHPADPETAWFVPAVKDETRIPVDGRVVVARTRDGGRSFDVLREGLPQEHAYDIVYRHALAIDDAGDTLVMGSTTGSLWITEDQGDHWELLTPHLPPVYAVRFG